LERRRRSEHLSQPSISPTDGTRPDCKHTICGSSRRLGSYLTFGDRTVSHGVVLFLSTLLSYKFLPYAEAQVFHQWICKLTTPGASTAAIWASAPAPKRWQSNQRTSVRHRNQPKSRTKRGSGTLIFFAAQWRQQTVSSGNIRGLCPQQPPVAHWVWSKADVVTRLQYWCKISIISPGDYALQCVKTQPPFSVLDPLNKEQTSSQLCSALTGTLDSVPEVSLDNSNNEIQCRNISPVDLDQSLRALSYPTFAQNHSKSLNSWRNDDTPGQFTDLPAAILGTATSHQPG
jgi:hypothetical protein